MLQSTIDANIGREERSTIGPLLRQLFMATPLYHFVTGVRCAWSSRRP